MHRNIKIVPVLSVLLAGAVAFTAAHRLGAQEPVAVGHAVPPGSAPGMKITDLGRASSRTYRLNMVKGDDIMTGLHDFAEKAHIKNGHFTGLGAIDKATLRWSDPVGNHPKQTEVNEEAEIVSLVGSLSTDKEGKPAVHAHTVLALSDGSTRGGHLVQAHVSIICEIFVTEEEGPQTNASR
jgi:uncharacterized protein